MMIIDMPFLQEIFWSRNEASEVRFKGQFIV